MANSKRRIKKIEHDRQSVLEHFVEGIILLSSFIVALITAACSIVGHFDVFQTISTTMLSFLCAEYIGHSFLLKSKYFNKLLLVSETSINSFEASISKFSLSIESLSISKKKRSFLLMNNSMIGQENYMR